MDVLRGPPFNPLQAPAFSGHLLCDRHLLAKHFYLSYLILNIALNKTGIIIIYTQQMV